MMPKIPGVILIKSKLFHLLFVSVVARRLDPFQTLSCAFNHNVIYTCRPLYNDGPSQFSLLNRPNHDCLWGKVTSFSLMKPPV